MAIRVPASGPKNARIMVVGEAPGRNEELEGAPFVGKSGQLLRDYFRKAGINASEVYFTNLVKFRPPGNRLVEWYDAAGNPNELVQAGLVELMGEILEVSPNVIMSCGSFPLHHICGKGRWEKKPDVRGWKGIMDWRGSIIESSMVPGIKVVPTFHPSYILQEGYSDHGTWMLDIQRVKEQAGFPEIDRVADKKEIIIDPRGEARVLAHLDLLSDMNKILTFDIEYIGKKLLCVGMTTSADKAYVFVIRGQGDVDFIRNILLSGIKLNAQNGMFDCSILEWWYDIPCVQHLVYDTMLAQHAANIELPKGLDYLCSIYTDQPFYKDMVDWTAIKAGKQNIDIVWPYNAIDVWTQHDIMEKQLADDLQDPKVRAVFDFEMQLVSPLWEMSKRGVKVDINKMRELHMTLDIEAREINAELSALFGEDFNVKSNQQVARFLFDKLGIPKGGATPGGSAKVDDKTLAELVGKCSNDLQRVVIGQIRDERERRDLISKFCSIELEDDGRLRGHYNPAGTNTGRLAAKKFYPTGRGAQQQNIPRDKRVRSVLVADPGKRFGYADLERAESFVVAHLSHDPRMLANHASGIDAHRRVGAFLFGVDESQVTGDFRYLAKRTAHAGNYLMGWKVFMTQVNADAAKTGISITAAQAKEYLARYKEYYDHLQSWWNRTEEELFATRMLTNLLGRQRQFFDYPQRILPEAVAFRPQSTVGDTLNVAFLNCHGIVCSYADRHMDREKILDLSSDLKRYGWEALMQIHDAIAYQYDEGYDREVDVTLRQLMAIPLYEPDTGEEFIIDLENAIGPSWGEVKVFDSRKAA